MTTTAATSETPTPDGGVKECKLLLPKSGIRLEGNDLVRRMADGSEIARHPLREINSLELSTVVYPSAVTLGFGLFGTAVAARLWVEQPLWSWAACIVASLVGVLLLVGSWAPSLRLDVNGDTMEYPLLDAPQDCKGFVVSVKGVWRQVGASE